MRKYQSAFTLLEVMVVMVIVGIMLGVVSVNLMPSKKQHLQTDAQRLALLLGMAREEAIVRNRPIAFDADALAYRFYILEGQNWQPITDLDMLREREFERAPVTITLTPPPLSNQGNLRIVFGRELVDKPYQLTLTSEEDRAVIHADGIGHFEVE